MGTLNKNYTRIAGTDAISTIDNTNDTQLTQIEADMTTIESHLDSVANPHTVTAAQVGLGSCDNTSDANKPVSSATQTALNAKANTNSPTLVTPTIGVATATSVNKVAITAPATSATIAITDGKTLTVPLDATVSGTNTGDQTDATLATTDVTTNNATAAKHGFLPKLDNTGSKFLRDDGTWVTPAGAGDVAGPATNTDTYIPQWDGNNTKVLKNGVAMPAGILVGDTATQTLTNKTLTSPNINEAVALTATATQLNTTINSNATEKALNTQAKARAYLGTNQTNLTDNAATKILIDTENYDIGSDFDAANKRFVAPVTGYYQVNAAIYYYSTVASKLYYAMIYVNGSAYSFVVTANGADANGLHGVTISDCVYAVAGQYIELYGQVTAGVNTVDVASGTQYTFLSIHLLSV